MYCRKCGALVKNNAFRCDNCGIGIFPLKRYNKINIVAIAGLIVSITSVFMNLYGFTGLAGIVISYISLKQIDKFVQKGRSIAIIGILTGIVSLIYTFLI